MMRIATASLLFALAVGCRERPAPTPAPVPAATVVESRRPRRDSPPSLIGTRPPEWLVTEWVNTKPLRLEDLRGKVVLVRWFTGTVCQDCTATAPALCEFDARYRDLGLAVVGMFHNSDSATIADVRGYLETYKYRFPVAIDRKVATRLAWSGGWDDYGLTSATFLLDRDGAIRYIHKGGRYVKGDSTYRTLEWEIERLLPEEPAGTGPIEEPAFEGADR